MAKELTAKQTFLKNSNIKRFYTEKQVIKYLEEHKNESWKEIKHPYDTDIRRKYMVNNKGQILWISVDDGILYQCNITDYFEATRIESNSQDTLLLKDYFKSFQQDAIEKYLLDAYRVLDINPENRYKKYKLKEIDDWITHEFETKLSPALDNENTFASLLFIIGEILRNVGIKGSKWIVKERLFYDRVTKIYIPYIVDKNDNIYDIYEVLRNHLLMQEGSWQKIASNTYKKTIASSLTPEEFEEESNRKFYIFSSFLT